MLTVTESDGFTKQIGQIPRGREADQWQLALMAEGRMSRSTLD